MCHKKCSQSGIALIATLCVMVILLIISLAVVSLGTGNLTTSGNIPARLQALVLANSACMYGINDLEENNDTSIVWAPDSIPPAPSGLTFADHTYSPIGNTNGLPGKISVAYINNLNNPNSSTVGTGPSFYPGISPIEVCGESAVIIAQGEYNGFKRTIQVTVKNSSSVNGADGIITVSNGSIMLNGILQPDNPLPIAGNLFAVNGINYDNISSVRILNGSFLGSNGSISKTGGGETIDDRFILQNQSDAVNIPGWSLANTQLTGASPTDTSFYTKETSYPVEASGLPVNSIKRPSFPTLTPDIADSDRYVLEGGLKLENQNVFVNGSLHIKETAVKNNLINSNLFINGVLTTETDIYGEDSNIFVTGYDPNGLSVSFIQDSPFDPNNSSGVCIFSEGDVKCTNTLASLCTYADKWISSAPEDITSLMELFNSIGLSGLKSNQIAGWYTSGTNSDIFPIDENGAKHVLEGCPNCNKNLIKCGIKPVPEDAVKWFKMDEAQNAMTWTGEGEGDRYKNWDGFVKNPSIYNATNVGFFQGVIFTHGAFTTEGSLYPVSVVGSVLAKNDSAVSPAGHGGNITLTSSSYILYCPSYLKSRSSQIIIQPILKIYSWYEL